MDCKSYTGVYIGVSVTLVILLCIVIACFIRYRWRIKYKLFLLCRNCQANPANDEDFEMFQLQYHAYVHIMKLLQMMSGS